MSFPEHGTSPAAILEALAQARSGDVRHDEFYIVHPAFLDAFRNAAPSLVCGEIDRHRACVTSRSYQAWRDAAAFE